MKISSNVYDVGTIANVVKSLLPHLATLRSPLEWKVNAFAAEVARVYGRGDDRHRNGEETVRWKGEGGEGFVYIMTGWWQLKYFVHFHPDPWGFMIPNFDEHIFQMGWFNHQPDDFEPGFFKHHCEYNPI